MEKSFRYVAVAALIGLGIWGWRVLFPSPERVIRSRLNALAKAVSFGPNEGVLAKAYNTQKLTGFFTPDVEIDVDLRGYPPQTLSGRDEVLNAALYAHSNLNGLKVQFSGINVALGADRITAKVNLTGRAILPGSEHEFNVLEFNFLLRKVDGQWLIYQVQTVKTLSLSRPALELA